MEMAMLVATLGGFVATAVATWVAWEQARRAKKEASNAEGARVRATAAQAAALAAQENAARALTEANRIAEQAKSIVEGAEARKLEHHNVRWEPLWISAEGKWLLANRGPDTARDVELSVSSVFYGHLPVERAEQVAPGEGLSVQFFDYIGTGGFPDASWEVVWRTPLGALRSTRGES